MVLRAEGFLEGQGRRLPSRNGNTRASPPQPVCWGVGRWWQPGGRPALPVPLTGFLLAQGTGQEPQNLLCGSRFSFG